MSMFFKIDYVKLLSNNIYLNTCKEQANKVEDRAFLMEFFSTPTMARFFNF